MSGKSLLAELDRAHKLLVPIAKSLTAQHRADLDKWTSDGKKKFDEPDWLWESLLMSFAVMGGARGAKGLLHDSERHNLVRYDALRTLPSRAERKTTLTRALRAAKLVRMPDKKAKWLLRAFDYISIWMGGPVNAKRLLMDRDGPMAKLDFLQLFDGIGPKSSRNMLMHACAERDMIAIDARIKSISRALGLTFKSYEDHQQFYLEVAKDAGIDGWSIDRLMFNYKDEFLKGLASGRTKAA